MAQTRSNQTRFEELESGLANVQESIQTTNTKVDALDAKFNSMEALLRTFMQRFDTPNRNSDRNSGEQQRRTNERSASSDESRNRNVNRTPESTPFSSIRSRKLEIPVFDGSNPDLWIVRAERYFALNRLSEEDKLEVAVISFEADALSWFLWEDGRRKIRKWEELKELLLLRFRVREEDRVRDGEINQDNRSNFAIKEENMDLCHDVDQRGEDSEPNQSNLKKRGEEIKGLLAVMDVMDDAKLEENTKNLEDEAINSGSRKELNDKFKNGNGSKSIGGLKMKISNQETIVSESSLQFNFLSDKFNITPKLPRDLYIKFVRDQRVIQPLNLKNQLKNLCLNDGVFGAVYKVFDEMPKCARQVFDESPEPDLRLRLEMLFVYVSCGLKPPKPPDYAINSWDSKPPKSPD